jgi:hypothetical protein
MNSGEVAVLDRRNEDSCQNFENFVGHLSLVSAVVVSDFIIADGRGSGKTG